MKLFIIKSLIFIILVAGTIGLLDYKGIFDTDETNNHVKRKWDTYYAFTQKHKVDILLLGNSHLYTGINPKTLSNYLGLTSFILAAPGTTISDTYFSLKEAVKVHKPKLVVIETFGIDETINDEFDGAKLSDQMKSFSSRKDVVEKINSAHKLFRVNDIPFAFSNTLRNHHFLFNNYDQIKTNISLQNESVNITNLYLGRYARFHEGLSDSLLNLYKTEGAKIDGNKFVLSEQNKEYIHLIKEFCKKEKIQLMFLTLPMYEKHVSNYDHWKTILKKEITTTPWLDFQSPYDPDFTRLCFENTYNVNQHMTYNGSLLAAYKTGRFIQSRFPKIESRSKELDWINIFYGEEGYFENGNILSSDKVNQLFLDKEQLGELYIRQLGSINKGNNSTLFAKIKLSDPKFNPEKHQIKILVKYLLNNQESLTNILLPFNKYHQIDNYYLFNQTFSDLKVLEVLNLEIIPSDEQRN